MKSFKKLSGLGLILFFIAALLWTQKGFAQEEECGTRGAIEQYWLEQEPPLRPVLQDEQTIGTANFVIHYSLTDPAHATTLQWAQSTATFAEESWSTVSSEQWALPPTDSGNGGDNRYDIYIRISGSNGMTTPEDPFPNPYLNGFSSWIEIRPDPIPNEPISDLDRLKVLVAHEFHHACQLRYTLPVPDDLWFMENTSVLMEKIIYPQINYLQYRLLEAVSPLRSPQFAISKNSDSYEYPGGLWPLFLNEFYDDNAATRKIWETAGYNPTIRMLPVVNTTLQQNYSSDLTEAVKQYAVWRYFTGSRADGNHFSDAAIWPTSFVHATHSTYPVLLTLVLDKVDGPGGTTYLQFYNGNLSCLDLTIDGEDGWQWSAYIIDYYSTRLSIETEFPLDAGGFGQTTVPWVEQEHVALMPVLSDWQNPISRRYFSYSADLSQYAVEFINRIAENNVGGELLLDQTEVITSGERRCFGSIETHTVKTLNERFGASPIYKHNQWFLDPNVYFLNDQFDPLEPYQYAEFVQLYPAVMRTDLTSANSNQGTIDFHDPWFLDINGTQPDQFFTYSSPHQPTGAANQTTGGVFLDQDYNIPGNPHYSVRAPQTQVIPFHNQNITWYFRNWEGEEVQFQDSTQTETAVVFRDTDPNREPQARAVYKGHLASDNNAASGPNNSRRLVEDDKGVYHAVYADDGHIWYTFSTDQGSTWTKEERLDDGDAGWSYLNPSITQYGGELQVAWSACFGSIGLCDVLQREREENASQWSPIQYLLTGGLITFGDIPQPVLAVYQDNTGLFFGLIAFAYRDSEADPLQIHSYYRQLDAPLNSAWIAFTAPFEGDHPSLASDESGLKTRIAYRRGGQIYSRSLETHGSVSWFAETWISSQSSWAISHQNPNISYRGNDAHIAWEATDDALVEYVLHRQIDYLDNLGTTAAFTIGAGSPGHPAVMVAASGPMVYYEDNGSIVKRTENTQFWLQEILGPGRFPSAQLRGSVGALWTQYSTPPYLIGSDLTLPSQAPRGPGRSAGVDTLLVDKRYEYLFPAEGHNAYMLIEMQHPKIGNRPVRFLNRRLRSLPFTVPEGGGRLDYQLFCRFREVTAPLDSSLTVFTLNFVENGTSHPLAALTLRELLPYNDGRPHRFNQQLSLTEFRGRRGYLQMSYGRQTPYLTNMVVPADSAQRLAVENRTPAEQLCATPDSQLPRRYRLLPNYPNPFNPTTTIQFWLPAAQVVKLVIYNVLGQKVRTLVDAPVDAGVHEALWDGLNDAGQAVASGIYIYRFEAADFLKVQKMILLR